MAGVSCALEVILHDAILTQGFLRVSGLADQRNVQAPQRFTWTDAREAAIDMLVTQLPSCAARHAAPPVSDGMDAILENTSLQSGEAAARRRLRTNLAVVVSATLRRLQQNRDALTNMRGGDGQEAPPRLSEAAVKRMLQAPADEAARSEVPFALQLARREAPPKYLRTVLRHSSTQLRRVARLIIPAATGQAAPQTTAAAPPSVFGTAAKDAAMRRCLRISGFIAGEADDRGAAHPTPVGIVWCMLPPAEQLIRMCAGCLIEGLVGATTDSTHRADRAEAVVALLCVLANAADCTSAYRFPKPADVPTWFPYQTLVRLADAGALCALRIPTGGSDGAGPVVMDAFCVSPAFIIAMTGPRRTPSFNPPPADAGCHNIPQRRLALDQPTTKAVLLSAATSWPTLVHHARQVRVSEAARDPTKSVTPGIPTQLSAAPPLGLSFLAQLARTGCPLPTSGKQLEDVEGASSFHGLGDDTHAEDRPGAWRDADDDPLLNPTAILFGSAAAAPTASSAQYRREGYVIVETNFRVYVYLLDEPSTAQPDGGGPVLMRLLDQFAERDLVTPIFAVYTLTRDALLAAVVERGLPVDVILRFLSLNSVSTDAAAAKDEEDVGGDGVRGDGGDRAIDVDDGDEDVLVVGRKRSRREVMVQRLKRYPGVPNAVIEQLSMWETEARRAQWLDDCSLLQCPDTASADAVVALVRGRGGTVLHRTGSRVVLPRRDYESIVLSTAADVPK